MSEESSQEQYESWNKEIFEKTEAVSNQAETISDNLLLTSTLIIGIVPLGRKVRSKVVGFDGSLFELVEAAREFIKDFESGVFCGEVQVIEGEDEEDDGE